MAVTLNEFQSARLAEFMADERESESWGYEPRDHTLRYSTRMPGAVEVVEPGNYVAKLLAPRPGAFQNDPRFQHATDIIDHRPILLMMYIQPLYLRAYIDSSGYYSDPCRHDIMDAKDVMPAGSCVYFSQDEDTFGAQQSTCDRD